MEIPLSIAISKYAMPLSYSKMSRHGGSKQQPGFGLVGRKIKVRANHFQVQVAEQDLFHYDVRNLNHRTHAFHSNDLNI